MNTSEMIAVMQAFMDGKVCEFKDARRGGGWSSCCNPDWNWLHHDYRIKPEEKKPKYRDIPITVEKDTDFLEAEKLYLEDWVSHKNFVGFRFADGFIRDTPVYREEPLYVLLTWDRHGRQKENVAESIIHRATHVVVEES